MSGRDLIYRDLSCWPTPLHYHPAHACGPFYLTLLHSPPPCFPARPLSVSRSIYLFIYVTVCLSVVHISYAYNLYVRPNQMDLPPHKRFIFFLQKQKRHAADCKRLVFLPCKQPLPLPLVAGAGRDIVMHFYLHQVTQCLKQLLKSIATHIQHLLILHFLFLKMYRNQWIQPNPELWN